MNIKIVYENELLPRDFLSDVEEMILDAILLFKKFVIINIDLEFIDGSTYGLYDQTEINIVNILDELDEFDFINIPIKRMTIVIK